MNALPVLLALLAPQDAESWPTLHGDLQRSGFYARFPAEGLKIVWRKELWKELTGPRAEVIVGDGLAFMGTYAGRMYAWDAKTGDERWVLETGGPIGHSPAFDSGVLFFGSMDRMLRAVEVATGKLKWAFEAGEGIWTSPAVHDGKVMLGARDGVFHALSTADGKPLWSFRTGAPILNSASVTPDGKRVLFASEDMHLYALDAKDGALAWKSRKLAGLSARDHFPTIVGGLALVTTNPVKGFHAALDQHQQLLLKRAGASGKETRYIGGTPEDVQKEQDAILEFLRSNPGDQTFHAFRLEDGKEPWIAPLLYTGGLHNPPTPPCVNLKTGDVYVLTRSAYGVWDGGGEVRPYTGVGKLDLKTGRVELLEHGWKPKEAGRAAGAKDMPWMTFNTIGDETQTLSCSPDLLLCTHQGFIGSLDLKTRLTKSLYGKRDTYGNFYGPATFGWEHQGGEEKARKAGQPFGLVNEWHGPAKAIVSVVGNRVYFPVGSQVMCLEGR